MADISCDIVVVGAGVLGLCVAVELTARGHDVRVVDPGQANASSVAAGMIAPAFESLLDGADAARAALLRDAAALWPAFAARAGIALDRTPAEWWGDDGDEAAGRLAALGFAVDRDDGLRATCDVRVDAEASLKALQAGLAGRVVIAEARSVEKTSSGWRLDTTARPVVARGLVVATGAAQALSGLPVEAAAIIGRVEPVAGQIGRIARPLTDRVLRSREGYVAPVEGGVLIGATMVFGSRDIAPDPAASDRLAGLAGRLLGIDTPVGIEWRGGVRGAMSDGLPLAGQVEDGLHLALAPRRNGWLLGPLVGRILADGIEGRSRGSHAAAFDPLRFSPLVD